MLYRYPWVELIFGRVTLAIATVVLAIACTVMSWVFIVGSAIFLIVHTVINSARDQNIVRRLGINYDRVQRSATQLISDLGHLSRFDIWMVDIYLPARRWSLSGKPFFINRSRILSRQLSVSLIDSLHQPPSVGPSSGPYLQSFERAEPLLWFDRDRHRDHPVEASLAFYETAKSDLAKNLAKTYGMLGVFPLVDQLNKNCIGVLAVHVKPELDIALMALGVLQTEQGRYRINNACVELNGLLA